MKIINELNTKCEPLNKDFLSYSYSSLELDALKNIDDVIDSNYLVVSENIKKPCLSIIGLGYVGAVSSACFSALGYRVIGVDVNKEKVSTLNKGLSPIVEEGLGVLLSKGHESGLLMAVTDSIDAVYRTDITLVSVGTPTNDDGVCDFKYLCSVSEEIGWALRNKEVYHLVVYRSTIPPKTTREILIPILEKFSNKVCGKDFGVCFIPEFLRESTAIKDFNCPSKTVIGSFDEKSKIYAENLYKNIDENIIHTDLEEAEFVKYVDNTWHALKVSFSNEVGRLCHACDVNGSEVMNIFAKDTLLNISAYYLKPGFAFGGSCLPKDTRGIMHVAKEAKVNIPLINNIIASNNQHILHALELIEKTGAKKVGFLGVTFKPKTDDLRESPVLDLMRELHISGHKICYFDTNVEPDDLLKVGLDDEVCSGNCNHFFELIKSVDVVVVGHLTDEMRKITRIAESYCPVIDLVGLGEEFKENYNYQNIC